VAGVTVQVRSQVLFAESSPGLLRIDSALMEDAGPNLPAGSPVTMVLRLPVSGVVSAVVEATVSRWAEDAGIVDMELLAGPRHARVVLSDGASTVRLEVEASGSLAA
jgi:hypothetical protein